MARKYARSYFSLFVRAHSFLKLRSEKRLRQPSLISFKRDKNIRNFFGQKFAQKFAHDAKLRKCLTQEIHQDYWSLHVNLRQCHLLHNLHLLQKVIHQWNRKTSRWPILRTPSRRRKKWQGRIQTSRLTLESHCGVSLHLVSPESHKTLEQKFISQIGTLYDQGINERFSFQYLYFLHINTTHSPSIRSDEAPAIETSISVMLIILNYPVPSYVSWNRNSISSKEFRAKRKSFSCCLRGS